MKKILGYPLRAEYVSGSVYWEIQSVIPMPCGAKILSVGLQEGRPTLWALVNPGAPIDMRTIHVVATESSLGDEFGGLRFIGTVVLGCGGIVIHVFE